MNMLLLEQMKCCGETHYSVTLVTGQTSNDEAQFVEGVEKTHKFDTESESQICFEHLRFIAWLSPYEALKKFNRYVKPKPPKLPLSKCVGQTKRIKHCVKRPDGSKSVWHAVLCGEDIAYTDDNGIRFFHSLHAFVSTHYKAEHPTRVCGNGWEECQAVVYGEWVKLAVMREVRV
jgi:hypothetical protein